MATQRWIAAKKEAISGPVDTRQQRVGRFKAIRRCNEALAPLLTRNVEDALQERSNARFGLQQGAIARSREYSLILHSRTHYLKRVQESLTPLECGF